MHRRNLLPFGLILLMGLLALGCSMHKITTPLTQSLHQNAGWRIGEIRDALPTDIDPEDRPNTSNIHVIKLHLQTALEYRYLFKALGSSDVDRLEVTGSLLEFNKGNSFLLYFLGGILGGSPTITMELELVNRETGEVLFSGNFKQKTSDYRESLNVCYARLAVDFASALYKAQEKIIEKS